MVLHSYNPSMKDMETTISKVHAHNQLHSNIKTSLGFMGPCVKKENP